MFRCMRLSSLALLLGGCLTSLPPRAASAPQSGFDPAQFDATLSDAKGEVHAEINGAMVHLRYLLRHPAIYMEQWLSLNADGCPVDNQAPVTVLGVPWARLSETITRVAAPPRPRLGRHSAALSFPGFISPNFLKPPIAPAGCAIILVAQRIFCVVVLVILFSGIKGRRRDYFGGDWLLESRSHFL